jgi:lipoyl(octanoyl) transferase
VHAAFDRARPGLFTAAGAKLAAIGVHVHRRVAIHGLALNVTTALDAFELIVPCGLYDVRVTSIAAESGARPELPPLAEAFAAAFGRASGRPLRRVDGTQTLLLDRPSLE